MPFIRQPYRQGTHSWITQQLFTLDNFGGGLNNVDPENTIADNEFTDTKNMRFVGNTLMEKRQGTEMVLNYINNITFADYYSPLIGDGSWVLANNEEIVFENSDGSFKSFPVNGRVHGVSYNGKYYYVDGVSLYVYNGEDYYKIIAEPFSYLVNDVAKTDKTITVDSIPESVKVGDVVWFTSGILEDYDNVNSTYGITKTITAIDSGTLVITLDSAVGYDIDAKEDFKVPVSFYEPSTKIYGDEVWDKEAHLAYYLPCREELADSFSGNSYIPDKPSIITVHNNRLFISGDTKSPNAVYMSSISMLGPQALYFPASASVSVTPNGKPIVDMVVFDNALIIGRNEDLFVLYGDTEYPATIVSGGTQFYLKQLDATTGFMNIDCGALINNYYIYLGYDGRFYALNTPTTYVEYLMTRPLDFKCDIYSPPFNLPKNTVVNTSTVAYRNEVMFSIDGDFVVVYNYDNMSFTYYTGWNAKCLYTDGLNLYIGAYHFMKWLDSENIYHDYHGETESYVPIKSKLSTKRYDLNMSAMFKYFKRFMLTTRAYENANSYIQVDFEIDYHQKNTSEDYIISSNNGRFGISEWGKASFGTQELLKSGWLNLDVRGRTIKFAFSNENVDEPMRIYDLNVLWGIRDIR